MAAPEQRERRGAEELYCLVLLLESWIDSTMPKIQERVKPLLDSLVLEFGAKASAHMIEHGEVPRVDREEQEEVYRVCRLGLAEFLKSIYRVSDAEQRAGFCRRIEGLIRVFVTSDAEAEIALAAVRQEAVSNRTCGEIVEILFLLDAVAVVASSKLAAEILSTAEAVSLAYSQDEDVIDALAQVRRTLTARA